MEKLYLKDMNEDQLSVIWENCETIRETCYEIVTRDAEFTLECVLRNVPSCCDYQIATYCQGEHFWINRIGCFYTSENIQKVKDWIETNYELRNAISYRLDSGVFQFYEDIETAIRYQSVLDDYTKYPKAKDEEYMERFVKETVHNMESVIYDSLLDIYEDYSNEDYAFSLFTDECGMQYFENIYYMDGELYEEVNYTKHLPLQNKDLGIYNLA